MAFKGVSGVYWFLGGVCFILTLALSFIFSPCLTLGGSFLGAFFVFDYVSFFLILISVLLLIPLFDWWGGLSGGCRFMLFLSIIMSFVCYCSSNVLVFWFSYELCILPLLFLLVSESAYSERFIAFWYLLGYVVLTSLPLLLSIVYLFGSWGGFSVCYGGLEAPSWAAMFIICVCFITKIPLPPFHVWLPIVHAEASSPVSVCLSGFIMKLGLLGVFRFSFLILPYYVFSFFYVALIFCFSVGFLVLSSQELDGKRWLAILSLSHIVLSALGLLVCNFSSHATPFVFCLGHGLSAGLVFIFLWMAYDIVGSRNWNLLKFGAGGGLPLRLLVAGSLCSVGSLPPTLSFFSEVRMVADSGCHSLLLLLIFLCYLFFSGLVPLFVIGGCLSRHFSMCAYHCGFPAGGFSCFYLLSLCFGFFLFS